jgi:hypothetical protein
MSKTKTKGDEMRAEYNWEHLGRCVRGKYAARCIEASNIVVIDTELTMFFPNSRAVNNALRALLLIASTAAEATGRSSRDTSTRASV